MDFWKTKKKRYCALALALLLLLFATSLRLVAQHDFSSSSLRFSNERKKASASLSRSGLVLCKEDGGPVVDGCFRYKKGTLTDPMKAENEMQTMDPDVLIRNEELVEKMRGEEMASRKPISRDVEDMRGLRERLNAFDAAERKEREERKARLTRANNRIHGVRAKAYGIGETPKPHKTVPFRAIDGFIFGQLGLAVYAFRRTRAPLAASVAALAFSGTTRAFTENWRVTLFAGLIGAFFGLFVLSMPVVEKVVDESVTKDLDDDGVVDDDDIDENKAENGGVVASYRRNFVQRNGVFVGRYGRDRDSYSYSLQRAFASMFS